MSYGLIIFDNDGVLVDSEPLANRVLARLLTDLGHPTTYEESTKNYMGTSLHYVHESVQERSGRPLPPDFDATYHARVFEAFRRDLRQVPGVVDVIEKLRADGVPYCVASSGSHEKINVALRTTGLDGLFTGNTIFSSQDVDRGKPAPDLFLHAAKAMGVSPEQCAVIEDSPAGVEAARAAGMDVYGFTAMTPPSKLANATALFHQMGTLPDLLA